MRGLYWWQFGTALPRDTAVVARLIEEYPPTTSPLYPLWEVQEIAGGQFRYAFIRDPSDHHASLWFMEFQNQVKAIVGTGEAIAKPPAD